MIDTIPSFGLGTFRVDAEKTAKSVTSALQLGYHHIDTAQLYKNEEAVGKGVRDSNVPREDIWITTKVWHDRLRRDRGFTGSAKHAAPVRVRLHLPTNLYRRQFFSGRGLSHADWV